MEPTAATGDTTMPRGQYPRQKIPVHRFSITFHERDWPYVSAAAKRAKLSVASFVRECVFKAIQREERPRLTDRRAPRAHA